MARVSKLWRLNIYLDATPVHPPREHVLEALYALQVEGSPDELDEIAGSPLGGPLVAIVKHMARSSGSYVAVELDGPSMLDDAATAPGGG